MKAVSAYPSTEKIWSLWDGEMTQCLPQKRTQALEFRSQNLCKREAGVRALLLQSWSVGEMWNPHGWSASTTLHISELWVWLRDPASMNKSRRATEVGFQHQPQAFICTYTHVYHICMHVGPHMQKACKYTHMNTTHLKWSKKSLFLPCAIL